MRVPLSWLADYVDYPADTDPHALAAQFAAIGLEEEDFFAAEVTGPLVVGRVLELTKEEHKNGKTVNWCRVDVGPEHNEAADDPKDPQPGEERPSRGIICGAHNFEPGDLVVVSLPGVVLPGDFHIAARKTYGHTSDGMICSTAELGLGDDHGGIIVLTDFGLTGEPGDDAIALLGLDDVTLDVNVTPDRGYQLSMRGIAREYAQMKGQTFTDFGSPAVAEVNGPTADGFPVVIDDIRPIDGVPGCDVFTALQVTGIDPTRATPYWMRHRLLEAGMRPISLTVDITNYVMLELGQPLHAYDTALLGEEIVVRRAEAGETFTTLDDIERTLDAEDLLITDRSADGSSKIIGLAGVMGGAAVEVSDQTTDVVIEAAHFDPISIARTSRRHKLSSEASRRFERGVDPTLGPVAARRCADLLVELAGGTLSAATTQIGEAPAPTVIDLAVDRVSAVVGVDYTPAEVVSLLEASAPTSTTSVTGSCVSRFQAGVPTSPRTSTSSRRSPEPAATTGFPRSSRPLVPVPDSPRRSGPGVGSRTFSPRTGSRRPTATLSPRRSAMTTCGSRPTIRAASTSGSRTRCPRICRSCARPCSRRCSMLRCATSVAEPRTSRSSRPGSSRPRWVCRASLDRGSCRATIPPRPSSRRSTPRCLPSRTISPVSSPVTSSSPASGARAVARRRPTSSTSSAGSLRSAVSV